jgi:protein-arginine kinase activator protein McsA
MMGMVRFRVATEFNVVNVVVSEDIQKQVQQKIADRVCLGCGKQLAEGEKSSLCQCLTCYSATYRALLAGTVTREQLTAEGRIAPQPKGPKSANAYTASLRNKK